MADVGKPGDSKVRLQAFYPQYIPGQRWAPKDDRRDRRGRRRGRGVPEGTKAELDGIDGANLDKEKIWQILFQLAKNPDPDAQHKFPSTLKNDERKYIHTACRKLNLKSKSRGKGIERFLTVWKSDEPKAQNLLKLQVSDAAFGSMRSFLDANYHLINPTRVFLSKSRDAKALASKARQRRAIRSENQSSGLSRRIQNHFITRVKLIKFQNLLASRSRLPSFRMRKEICSLVASSRVSLISGATGCGKSTQVPQFILSNYVQTQSLNDSKNIERIPGEPRKTVGGGRPPFIVCTQPRRLSAIALASRVADEFGGEVGDMIGYQIRLESKASQNTVILFCTVGILLRRLLSDPEARNMTHIIVDEVHERDRLTDFLLIILRHLVRINKDIRIVLMSATLNADKFAKYFNEKGVSCPRVDIPGMAHKVDVVPLEDVLTITGYKPRLVGRGVVRDPHYLKLWTDYYESKATTKIPFSDIVTIANLEGASVAEVLKPDFELITRLVTYIVTYKPVGAILIFLPGWGEISKCVDKLNLCECVSRRPDRFKILPLHSAVAPHMQREIFKNPPRGVWKIVVSTNIAETSITIDDVLYVIDSGLAKEKAYDSHTKMSSLTSRFIAKAQARQRQGRAGRVRAGTCYRLFSMARYHNMADYQTPEMLRTPLEELVLQVKLLRLDERVQDDIKTKSKNSRIAAFLTLAIEPPNKSMIGSAIDLLRGVGALSDADLSGNYHLTPLGAVLANMPCDPRIAKMLVYSANLGCLSPVISIAASISYRNPFVMCLPFERERARKAKLSLADGSQSDGIAMANAYSSWVKANQSGNGWNFCKKHFLSPSSLRMIRSIRGQLFRFLKDAGVVDRACASPEDRKANFNSADYNLIRALVGVGAYPNVAVGLASKNGKIGLETRDGMNSLKIHPSSANMGIMRGLKWGKPKKSTQQEKGPPPPFACLAFFEILRSTDVFLHTTSVVSPLSLLLLGGSLSPFKANGQKENSDDDGIAEGNGYYVARQRKKRREKDSKAIGLQVDEFLRWSCSPGCVEVVTCFRRILDTLLLQNLPDTPQTKPLRGGVVREVIKVLRDVLGCELDEATERKVAEARMENTMITAEGFEIQWDDDENTEFNTLTISETPGSNQIISPENQREFGRIKQNLGASDRKQKGTDIEVLDDSEDDNGLEEEVTVEQHYERLRELKAAANRADSKTLPQTEKNGLKPTNSHSEGAWEAALLRLMATTTGGSSPTVGGSSGVHLVDPTITSTEAGLGPSVSEEDGKGLWIVEGDVGDDLDEEWGKLEGDGVGEGGEVPGGVSGGVSGGYSERNGFMPAENGDLGVVR
ncbi:hypothetical protein AAMO2058_001114100 [Amorphochlora amoebiformis]